jgi:hypothetical protein
MAIAPFSATAPVKSLTGSATKPGVTFSGDEDTGLYNPAPDELAIAIGGAEAAKFTASGLEVGGDINLDDGGAFQVTLQQVTPTAARTITFPDATGTVGLVAGSTGQLVFNNAGAYSGLSGVTTNGTDITLTGRFISSLNGAASAPPGTFTGTWFAGGTATTTKPQVLIEPTGTTSTAWSTSGTGLGVNAPSGFAGNLLDLRVNSEKRFEVNSSGVVEAESLTLSKSANAPSFLSLHKFSAFPERKLADRVPIPGYKSTTYNFSHSTSPVLAGNGCVYLVPGNVADFVKFNPVDKSIKKIPVTNSAFAANGQAGVLAPNGKIYMSPNNGDVFAVLDPKDDSAYYLTVPNRGTKRWWGGTVGFDGCLYFSPRVGESSATLPNEAFILKIDPSTDEFSFIPTGVATTSNGWAAMVVAPNGKIYAIPRNNASQILALDYLSSTTPAVTIIATGVSNANNAIGGATLAPNGNIYVFPRNSRYLIKLDPEGSEIGEILTFTQGAGTTLAGEADEIYELVEGAASISGLGATFTVTRDSNGDISNVVLVSSGSGYVPTETITIDGSDIGGVSVTDDLIITIDTVAVYKEKITVTQGFFNSFGGEVCSTCPTLGRDGLIYICQTNRDFVILFDPETETIVGSIDAMPAELMGTGGISNFSVGGADPLRAEGVYLISEEDIITDGEGEGLTLSVTVNGSGQATVSFFNAVTGTYGPINFQQTDSGINWAVGDTITISDTLLGSGGGADLIITITAISTQVRTFGNILLPSGQICLAPFRANKITLINTSLPKIPDWPLEARFNKT